MSQRPTAMFREPSRFDMMTNVILPGLLGSVWGYFNNYALHRNFLINQKLPEPIIFIFYLPMEVAQWANEHLNNNLADPAWLAVIAGGVIGLIIGAVIVPLFDRS